MDSNNDSAFETLIASLMSPGNETRRQAEATFSSFKQRHPDALVLKLIITLRSCAQAETRGMCAVLLRKQLDKKSSAFLWPRLSPATRSALKTELILCLQREETWGVIKKVCDTVAELATVILVASWPELVAFMFSWASSESPRLKESALILFGELCDYMQPHVATLRSVFQECLAPASTMDVRVAALRTTAKFAESLGDIETFQHLVPDMKGVLTDALNKGDEAVAMEALEVFVELAGSEPRFLQQNIVDVVACMLQIAKADGLEEGTRHLAVEFLIALAEIGGLEEGTRRMAVGFLVGLAEGRSQCQNLPHEFVGRLFAALTEMLLDIEDDPLWHLDCDDGDACETNNSEVGQECLDRLAKALGGEVIIPVAVELLPGYLPDPDWRKRHAGLITFAQIAEGCAKEMIKYFQHVVPMVLNLFHDSHARVRWAAIHAIGLLSTDLSPDFQEQQYQQVLPALTGAMNDFQNPRVQAHATAAVFNFCENCTPDVLAPYLDGIVGRLLILLQNGKQMVQEVALTALASIADSSKEHFLKCYDDVMPCLKAILAKASDNSNQRFCAKLIECINLVGIAVGKDKFRHDAKEVMEMLMTIQGSQIDADERTLNYIFQGWERLCKCLGQEFLRYMNVVMPPVLRSAQLQADVSIAAADLDDIIDGSSDESVQIITIDDKIFGVKTAVLEEKATACSMLCCCADELKEGFYPWIEQVASTLVPLLEFYFHEEIRKVAASAMPALLRSAKLAVEKRQAEGQDETYIKQLSDYIIPSLVEALHKEPNIEICSRLMQALNECMEISGILLDDRHVRSIVEEFKEVITECHSRSREHTERIKAEDFDAEEGESLKDEINQEYEVFVIVGECIGTLIKRFKDSFLPFFDELLSYITPMLGKDKEKIIAISIFDDVAEQCGEAASKYYDTFFPFLLEACNVADAAVRQAAVYGIGICAEFGGIKVKPMIGEALSRLNTVTSQPNAHDTSNIMVTDNAVSALGKICQFHQDCIDGSQVIPAWLNFLPIKGDLIEAKVVHEQLCSMVERSDEELLGPSNQFLPKIVSIFTEVLCSGKDLVTEQTAGRMVNILRRLQQTLSPSALASTWSALQPQQQLALQSILSSFS